MKNLKKWLIALALLLPAVAQAQIYGAVNSSGSVSGASIVGTGGTTETLPTTTDTLAGLGQNQTFTGTNTFSGAITPTGTIATQGLVFSNALGGNPITFTRFISMSLASVNAGTTILASASGRTVFPGNFMIMGLNGAAAGATSVIVECTDAATVLSSYAIAALPANLPQLALSSNTVNNRFISSGQNLITGCPAGQGVMVSTLGTLTGPTSLLINLPYTVQ